MPELISLSAYGERHGVSRQAVTKWRLRGRIVMQGELVDVAASDARMRAAGKGPWNNGVKAVKARLRAAPDASSPPEETDPWTNGYVSGLQDGGEAVFAMLEAAVVAEGCVSSFAVRLRDRLRPSMVTEFNRLHEDICLEPGTPLLGERYFTADLF